MQDTKRSGVPVLIVAVILAIIASAITTVVLMRQTTFGSDVLRGQPAKKSDLQAMLDSGVIRAGYVSNPPSCIINPNTGKVSGIFADAINIIAEKASLKVEWTEEVGFGSMIEGLNTRRYDLVPCALWPTITRARHATFSQPLFYSGIGVYVRANDNRFTGDLSRINDPSVKIATIDGEMAAAIAKTDFQRATEVALPQLSEIATMLLNVKEGKADVTFVEKYFAYEFMNSNPGSLKNITEEHPIRTFPNTVLLRSGQPELLNFINTSLGEVVNLGIINQLLDKYEPEHGTFYPLAKPYVVPHE